jgi:hypothetical protein
MRGNCCANKALLSNKLKVEASATNNKRTPIAQIHVDIEQCFALLCPPQTHLFDVADKSQTPIDIGLATKPTGSIWASSATNKARA